MTYMASSEKKTERSRACTLNVGEKNPADYMEFCFSTHILHSNFETHFSFVIFICLHLFHLQSLATLATFYFVLTHFSYSLIFNFLIQGNDSFKFSIAIVSTDTKPSHCCSHHPSSYFLIEKCNSLVVGVAVCIGGQMRLSHYSFLMA